MLHFKLKDLNKHTSHIDTIEISFGNVCFVAFEEFLWIIIQFLAPDSLYWYAMQFFSLRQLVNMIDLLVG